MEVEMKIRGLMMDPVTNMPIVILKDIGSDTVLPIWVGVYEANAIALEIEKVTTPRPMTHDLIKNVLVGLESQVRKVVVTELRDDTFFAVIWVERDGRIISIDSRPSDALALALRVMAIASVGAVFTLTTDPTRLADSLVRQAGVSPRFAYGALAAYQAIPRFAEDLTTLRQARRIRGLRGSWHPRLLVTLLVLAIRHGDRMALAMDARAFGAGPMTHYRDLRWAWLDGAVALGAAIVLGGALALAGTQ